MSLASKAVTAGRMLARPGAAITAELTAIEGAGRRADDNRRVRYAAAAGFISAVAIPASLILACPGISTAQVSSSRSMFSHQYPGRYPTAAAVIVLGAVLSLAPWAQQRRDARQHRAAGSGQGGRWHLMNPRPERSCPIHPRR